MARPTKLTKDLTEQICRAIRAGNYAKVAAQAAGIAESTYHRWMEQGRCAKRGLHRDFYDAVKQAEAEAEARAVAFIAKEMASDWRAAKALLEGRFGERWRRSMPNDAPIEERAVFDLKELSEKELKTLERLNARLTEQS